MRSAATAAALVAVVVLCSVGDARASEGDDDPMFRGCQLPCHAACDRGVKPELSWELKLMFWSCRENCNYECMHEITAKRVSAGAAVYKYFGKWPFRRVFGMQELFSVLFSVLNAVPHLWFGWTRYRRNVPDRYPLKSWWLAYGAVACNTWLWSAVFHARDLRPTERLDYYCASVLIVFSLAVSSIRILRVRSLCGKFVVLLPLMGLLANHIRYLQFVHFDYGYNMKASAVVALSYASLWVGWSVMNRQTRRYAWKAGFSAAAMIAFAALEIFDFPPFFELLDAHAMWHGLTVPLGFLFWTFLADDAAAELAADGHAPAPAADRRALLPHRA